MASPYDLTTLNALKAWLSIANDNSDPVLIPTITAASRWVLSYLSRDSVLPTTIAERRDGTGRQRLYLRNWPVLSVSQLLIDGTVIAASPAPAPGVGCLSGYLLSPWDGRPPGGLQAIDVFGYGFVPGRQNIAITYLAGYAVQSEAQTVPASPGPYTVAPIAPYGPWGSDMGVTYASGAPFTAVATPTAAGQYSVAAGVYTFNAADAAASVLLSYGYVPQDLSQAVMELAGERFKYRDRIGQSSKSLGGQETTAFSLKDMPDAMKLMLQPFRSVVVPA